LVSCFIINLLIYFIIHLLFYLSVNLLLISLGYTLGILEILFIYVFICYYRLIPRLPTYVACKLNLLHAFYTFIFYQCYILCISKQDQILNIQHFII